VVCSTEEEVRHAADLALAQAAPVRALLAPHVPSGIASALAGEGIAVLRVSDDTTRALLVHPAVDVSLASAGADGAVTLGSGGVAHAATWLARGDERGWVASGIVGNLARRR
jgi:hypothetical protein